MTTTAFDDQFTTPATQTILRVNVIESQQQIHDLQTRLAAAIERADRAEAELAKLRKQKPVAWCDPVEFKEDPWSFQGFRCRTNNYPTMPLYAAPIPAVPAEWREAMQEAHDTFQRYADLHRAKDTRDGHEKAKLNQKLANKLYALLQSAEVQAGDKWNLTPAPTHPVDRNAGEVRHD